MEDIEKKITEYQRKREEKNCSGRQKKNMKVILVQITRNNSDSEDDVSDDLIQKHVSKADRSDTFDFTQIDLEITYVLEEEREKTDKTKKKDLQCHHCEYKCKSKNTLRKHMNTKHAATRM